MANRKESWFNKDPDAVLDYEFDWSAWLTGGETISSHTITVTGVTLDSSTTSTSSVVAWVSGGVLGEMVKIECEIVTSAGRTDERTIQLFIENR